jgi:uncharacterized protein
MNRVELVRQVVDEIVRRQPDVEERRCGFVHLYGVAQTCALLALKRGLDPELCTVAGMLHDIWSYKTGDPTNHATLGCVEAQKILSELGHFTQEEIAVISEAISYHSDKGEVDGTIDELLKDADVLQHFLYNTSLPPHEWVKGRLPQILGELGLSETLQAGDI